MTKAIVILLVVIALCMLGVGLTYCNNYNDINCCQLSYDSSYIIAKAQYDTTLKIQKINDTTLTSIGGSNSINSTFDLVNHAHVAFRLLATGGVVDIRIGDVNAHYENKELMNIAVRICRDGDELSITMNDTIKRSQYKGTVKVGIEADADTFKLTSLDNDANTIKLNNEFSYHQYIDKAIMLFGSGILKGSDYSADFCACGDYFSAIYLDNFDLIYFTFLVRESRTIDIELAQGDVLPLSFCRSMTVEVKKSPTDSKILFNDGELSVDSVGEYLLVLYNEYEQCEVFINCYKDSDSGNDSMPEVPEYPLNPDVPDKPSDPDEPSDPDKPNDFEEPNTPDEPSDPDKPNDPNEPSDSTEPNTPDKPSNSGDDVYITTVDWAKVGMVIAGFAVAIIATVAAIILLKKKKK